MYKKRDLMAKIIAAVILLGIMGSVFAAILV